MIKTLRITIRVQDQEEALRFYTQKLGFEKRAALPMGANRRCSNSSCNHLIGLKEKSANNIASWWGKIPR